MPHRSKIKVAGLSLDTSYTGIPFQPNYRSLQQVNEKLVNTLKKEAGII